MVHGLSLSLVHTHCSTNATPVAFTCRITRLSAGTDCIQRMSLICIIPVSDPSIDMVVRIQCMRVVCVFGSTCLTKCELVHPAFLRINMHDEFSHWSTCTLVLPRFGRIKKLKFVVFGKCVETFVSPMVCLVSQRTYITRSFGDSACVCLSHHFSTMVGVLDPSTMRPPMGRKSL